jgi:hypothetical protein
LEDAAGVAELREGDAEALVAHAEVGAQVEGGEQGAREVVNIVGVLLGAHDLEVELALAADELERDGVDGCCGAMLDGQEELFTAFAQIERGVDPRVEIAAAS